MTRVASRQQGRKTWRRLGGSASRVPTRSLPYTKAREHAIEDIIWGHHADQVVERPHRGVQVRRGGGGVHAALPGGVERIDLAEGTLERAAVACPRHHRLHVAQREQPTERHFRELALQVGEALAG